MNKYDELNDVIEIDLKEIFGVLLHRLWLILLIAALGGGVGFGVSNYLIPEQFESKTRVYIINKEEKALAYSDLQIGTSLTKDYIELIKGRYVLESVIKNVGLEGVETYASLAERVQVTNPADTRIIEISVTDRDPLSAQILADEIRNFSAKYVQEVMDLEAVNLVETANLPKMPSSPSVMKWTALGILLGGFLCSGLIIVRFILDDTVKTAEDIEKYLDGSMLAMIPLDENEDKPEKKKKKKKSKAPKASEEEETIEDLAAAKEEK